MMRAPSWTSAGYRLGALLSVIGFWLFPTPCAAEQVSPAPLAREMKARIHELAPDATLSFADSLSLRVEDGRQAGGQINFDRLATFCKRNDATACKEQKESFAAAIAESLVALDDTVTLARLRVVVRSDEYIAGTVAQLSTAKASPLVTKPVAKGVNLILAADFPKTTRLVNENDITALGLTRDQAIAVGIKQVLVELPPLPAADKLTSSVIAIAGYNYGASYLLADDQWSALAKTVHGILWIAVPADEQVMVGVFKTEGELQKLKAIVSRDYETAPRGISPLIYRWDGGKWFPLD